MTASLGLSHLNDFCSVKEYRGSETAKFLKFIVKEGAEANLDQSELYPSAIGFLNDVLYRVFSLSD